MHKSETHQNEREFACLGDFGQGKISLDYLDGYYSAGIGTTNVGTIPYSPPVSSPSDPLSPEC
jgi:hypothetical protein